MRRLLIGTVLTLSAVMVVVAAHPVTFLLRNGQRINGGLTYKGGTAYTLDGRDYPSDDVAVIAFVPGDPPASEVDRIPKVDNNPVELERHVFVTRDGQMLFGKLYKFSPDGETITFDQREGSRRDISANDMARIYINPSAARFVYGPILATLGSGGAVATSGGNGTVTVTVNANQPWTDTGISVREGEVLRFRVGGQIQFTPTERATAAGSTRQQRVPNAPLPGVFAGALIGRVGNGAPFVIGDQQSVRMPSGGQLYLGINDDNVSDNTGTFQAAITR